MQQRTNHTQGKRFWNQICLIGGLAVQYWVEIRKTDDIDLAVFGKDIDRVKKEFLGGQKSLLGYSFKLDGVNVDVLSADHFDWAEATITNAIEYDFIGTKIKVAMPECLILFKLVSMRDRNVSDVLALLTLKGVPNKARDLVWKYKPTDIEDFEQMIKMAEMGQI